MIQYEELPTIEINESKLALYTDRLPEVMHLDDEAVAVLIDLSQTPVATATIGTPIDKASDRMKLQGVHILFILDNDQKPVGLITSQDILGELPIKIQEERRIPRGNIAVEMIMKKTMEIPALKMETVMKFKIGNVINTLKHHKSPYALVIKSNGDDVEVIRGLFSAHTICQKLHIPNFI